MKNTKCWQSDCLQSLTRASMLELLNASIPGVSVSNFASEAETDTLIHGLSRFPTRSQSIKQVVRLGISQYQEGVRGSKQDYFSKAAELQAAQKQLFKESFNPIQRLMALLTEVGFETDIMQEPGYGAYYAGVGKSREGFSPIHVDYAPQDSADWAVGGATAQLAWNLYLNTPEGGKLLIWNKLWRSEDDSFQVNDNYYFSDDVVEGQSLLELSVKKGELIIINSRNFHAISKSSNRLTFGSFISYFPENYLSFWS